MTALAMKIVEGWAVQEGCEHMTIEDMRKAVEEFCETQEGCQSCPCKPDERGNCYSRNDEKHLRENFKIAYPNDVVNHPSHYTQGGIECIDAMKSAFGTDELAVYCKIAAFKYIWRCEHKNGLEDIKKAVWYLEKYLELFEEKNDGEI